MTKNQNINQVTNTQVSGQSFSWNLSPLPEPSAFSVLDEICSTLDKLSITLDELKKIHATECLENTIKDKFDPNIPK